MAENDKNVKISEYSQYVTLLEKRLVELGEENKILSGELEVCKHQMQLSKETERLTDLWARGEIEN